MIIEPFIMSISNDAPETNIEFEMHISSNQNGYIEYTKTIPLTYSIIAPEIMLGDLNQDEIINVLDIVLLVNIIIGSEGGTDLQLQAGDINQDGMINVQDIVLLVNLVIN